MDLLVRRRGAGRPDRSALLGLGHAAEAAPLLEKALAAQDVSHRRDRCPCSVRAAGAHVRTGDAERVRELGRQAARLSRHCGPPRLAAALESLHAELDGR